jgi:hypothetical protein
VYCEGPCASVPPKSLGECSSLRPVNPKLSARPPAGRNSGGDATPNSGVHDTEVKLEEHHGDKVMSQELDGECSSSKRL